MNSSLLDTFQSDPAPHAEVSVGPTTDNSLAESKSKFTSPVSTVITPEVTQQQLEKRQMRPATLLLYILLYIVAGGVIYGAFQLWLKS
ncbi:MAG: hypothetical protein P8L85_11550 [Rubripirellula sp.]|nr:hypothetical protein [Rubripirellula sp.]